MNSYWFGTSEHPVHDFLKGESLVDCAICGNHHPHPIHAQRLCMVCHCFESHHLGTQCQKCARVCGLPGIKVRSDEGAEVRR